MDLKALALLKRKIFAAALYVTGVPADVVNQQIAHFREEANSGGSSADTSLSTGAWNKRTLTTTKTNTITGCSLASSQITLPAGTYDFRVRSPVYNNTANSFVAQAKIRNVTDSSDAFVGSVAFIPSGSTVGIQEDVWVEGRITITAQKVFEIDVYVNNGTGTATGGFGSTTGVNQVFTEVWIKRVG